MNIAVSVVFLLTLVWSGHCFNVSHLSSSDESKFCKEKRYQQILFISQYKYGVYLIFGKDDLFYQGVYNGTAFSAIPIGPFELSSIHPGARSIAKFVPNSNVAAKRFAFMLFVQPGKSEAVMQFLGNQVWFIDGKATAVKWPANCPAVIDNIINRSIQPHIVFDPESYYYNLTIDLATGQPTCSARSVTKSFSEPFYAAMGVDSPLSVKKGSAKDSPMFQDIRVFRWTRGGKICQSMMPLPGPVELCSGSFWQLPNDWQFFACPDPNLKPSSRGKVALLVFVIVAVVSLLGITIYCLAKRLFRSSKDEIGKSALFSSQIQ